MAKTPLEIGQPDPNYPEGGNVTAYLCLTGYANGTAVENSDAPDMRTMVQLLIDACLTNQQTADVIISVAVNLAMEKAAQIAEERHSALNN